MSATPMFDRSDEIIFYLNLLLENDKRPLLNKNEIFNEWNNWRKLVLTFLIFQFTEKLLFLSDVEFIRAKYIS